MKALPVVADHPEIPLYAGDLESDLAIVARNRLAEKITGGLSITQKMPCPSIGLSAFRCRIGSVLAGKEGSVCSDDTCYAKKGRYLFTNVQKKLEQRYQGLFDPLWTPSMVFLIRFYCDRYFRLFDSGDVQGVNHMKNLCTVARHAPDVQIWMPTKEAAVVRACKDEIPDNLIVRLSGTMVDGPPPKNWSTTSVVYAQEPPDGALACPSKENGGACGTCRACWSNEQHVIAYKRH